MEFIFDFIFTLIGFVGCLMFAFCNAPQIHKTYKDKDSGLANAFLIMQLLGNVFNVLYIEYTNIKNNVWQYPMYVNYIIALILLIILIIMKDIYDKKKKN